MTSAGLDAVQTACDLPEMATKKRASPSGSNRSYDERLSKGQPNVTFSLAIDVNETINHLKTALGITRSQVVTKAIRDLDAKVKPRVPTKEPQAKAKRAKKAAAAG